jgi:predicted nucleic acid-binding protein
LVIVVDASLAVKWYLLEALTPEALKLLADHGGDIVVPDIFVTEVIGALVRRANVDKSLRSESQESISRFVSLFDAELISAQRLDPPAIARAADLALDLGHPLKDCHYLALAMDQDCDLITCDARFAAKAKGVWERVRLLGDGS